MEEAPWGSGGAGHAACPGSYHLLHDTPTVAATDYLPTLHILHQAVHLFTLGSSKPLLRQAEDVQAAGLFARLLLSLPPVNGASIVVLRSALQVLQQ